MLRRSDITELIYDCAYATKLRKGEFIVVYGAAMVLRFAKKECNDIDIVVSPKAFDRVANELGLTPMKYSDIPDLYYIHYKDHIDLFRGTVGCKTDPVGTELPGCEIITQTLESLKYEKLTRGRENDLEDVELIYKAIRRQNARYKISK